MTCYGRLTGLLWSTKCPVPANNRELGFWGSELAEISGFLQASLPGMTPKQLFQARFFAFIPVIAENRETEPITIRAETAART